MSRDEYDIQFKEMGKLIICVCGFSLLYALGGIHGKWIRRFVAPLYWSGTLWLFTRNWRVFVQGVLLMPALCLGYGATEFVKKLARRALFGLATSGTALGPVLASERPFKPVSRHKWIGLGLHIALVTAFCVVLGVLNPFHARIEEMLIGMSIVLLPTYMIDEKK